MSRTPASPRLRGPLAALAAATVAAGYVLAVRPRMLHWGATAQETAAPLPGDELVRTPRMQSTRAVTINAPAATVWAWLVQLGAGRGGMYSYDLLENAAGPGMHSADRILPDYQQLDVGDLVPLVLKKATDVGIPVRRMEAGSVLGLGGTMDPRTGKIRPSGGAAAGPRVELGWTFVLQPVHERRTRLLSRTRYDYSPLTVGLILRPVLEPLQFVMERRMLLGIKSRAEGRGRQLGGRRAS
ncbi:MAG TPA: SRPBCC family protein [Arthrobacter sp.]|nr:SRPBCC family protein [Arthrobacter sp.]